MNVLPRLSLLVTLSEPPIFSIIFLHVARPKPDPTNTDAA